MPRLFGRERRNRTKVISIFEAMMGLLSRNK